jgi:peptidyl-prolyl cis-trans isomerase A (cyclophilin A)
MNAGPHSAPRSSAAGIAALLLFLTAGCGEEVHTVPPDSVLLDPTAAAFTGQAPDTFHVRFQTTRGDFVVEGIREWAPLGADRFYNLVRNGFYDGVRFYRVVDGFMVQFGLHGDPAVTDAWMDQAIPDDPVTMGNWRGRITFATAGPDTRTTEVFINFIDNLRLDVQGFAPFGQVVEGMDVVDGLYAGYGETSPGGSGPVWERLVEEGNAYLEQQFPALDHVLRATIVER